ncbi:MAG: hypothetical protein D6720_07650 [Gammaproteobacteria bacterium]|nr:MAG: hypothetical protein D6720_07650 [Gammaproteobacteria bacterium]
MYSMAKVRGARSRGADQGSSHSRFHRGWMFLLGGWAIWLVSSAAFSADDYVSELESEATKVEAREIDPAEGKEEVVAPPEGRAVAPVVPVRPGGREAFETLLKDHYLGTYRFYKKLPERSREEIFEQYRGGADIAVIRNKIVTRLLQE